MVQRREICLWMGGKCTLDKGGDWVIKLIAGLNDKDMAAGMRNISGSPLSDEEIRFVRTEIRRICADESKFVFNDEGHIKTSTCYNFIEDKIYVTRNVFPDDKYGSVQPDRDKSNLVLDAVYRAKEYGHLIEMDDFMKEAVYGYAGGEKNIAQVLAPINYVSEAGSDRANEGRVCDSQVP